MNSNSNSKSKFDRSDSGPVGPQYRDALGLEDDELLDEVWDSTKTAIAAEGLRDLKRKDRGGYGVVCQAIEERTGNPRAIKVVLHPEDQSRMEVFAREQQILEYLQSHSPGIAPHFFGAKAPPGAQPFLIQEWIEGTKLSDWLDARPDLPMNERESLCRAIFDTYSRLHDVAKVIHRDVSMGNIMIAGRRVRLIDFGGGGRAAPSYRSLNTMSRVPTTEAFVSQPVRDGERKPTIPDEVHAVAKVCFTVLTGQLAYEVAAKDWAKTLKQAGVCREIARFLLPKMETPPEKIARMSQAKEF